MYQYIGADGMRKIVCTGTIYYNLYQNIGGSSGKCELAHTTIMFIKSQGARHEGPNLYNTTTMYTGGGDSVV